LRLNKKYGVGNALTRTDDIFAQLRASKA
jgi:hypothetical protein